MLVLSMLHKYTYTYTRTHVKSVSLKLLRSAFAFTRGSLSSLNGLGFLRNPENGAGIRESAIQRKVEYELGRTLIQPRHQP